jgi:hypothetical protein
MAQHSVHLTLGKAPRTGWRILQRFGALSTPKRNPTLKANPSPARQRVPKLLARHTNGNHKPKDIHRERTKWLNTISLRSKKSFLEFW